MAVNNSFKEAQNTIEGIKWDEAAPTQYANALYGLTKQQRKLILSTRELTQADREEINAKIESIRESQVRNAAIKANIDIEKQNILVGKLRVEVADRLNKKIIASAAAEAGLTEAQKKQVTAALLGTAANQKLSFSFQTLKANAIATWQAMIHSPMFAISAIITIISLLVSVFNRLKQKEEETRQKMLEVADAAKDEAAEIKNLYEAYQNANEAYKSNTGSKEDLKSATDSLLEKLGYEKSEIADLTNEYGTLEKAIDNVTQKALEQKMGSVLEGYEAAKEDALALARDSKGWFAGDSITIKTSGDDRKFAEQLQKAGFLGDGELPSLSTSFHTGINDYSGFESLAAGYEKLLKMKEELESGIGLKYTVDELSESDVYHDINTKINAVADSIAKANNYMEEYNKLRAQSEYMEYVNNNGIPESAEQYNALKQSMLDAAEASGKYFGTQDEMKSAIVNVLEAVPALQKFVGTYDDAANGVSVYRAQLEQLTDVLSGLSTDYDILNTARDEMSNGGGLTPETIKKLADSEENYLDYLYEENGVVKLNTEAWKENANAKMLGEIDEIQKEIGSLEEQNATLRENISFYKERQLAGNGAAWDDLIADATEQLNKNTDAIAENQGKLTIYTSLFGSITGDLDAYTAALQNFSNVSSTIDSITGSFQTLANLQATVANGFTLSLDKALEFAKVYPQILDSAQVTADGQIMLNEGVVNSFIEGKKAELDAQIDAKIAELEGDKAVWQAKMEAAQAKLDLAKSVAEGEGGITKELAEYRINAGNAVAQALIDADVDQAAAFKLAAAAMAQNAEEFNRVAMEVCTDVNGNFDKAAYGLAQTMYKNLTNVKTDLASVARQAHETADAIAGVANGDSKAGSSAIQGGSGGGTAGRKLKFNLTSGRFKGTEYTYTAKESGLEDFVSQIELDISNYQDAIKQIDGQIATLQALKNLPLSSFKGKSGSGGSGSNSASKDVEEYTAAIEDYREAIERLRKAQEVRANIGSRIEESEDLKAKILLEKQLIGAYEREQDALHNLNNLRDGTITKGVAALRELGFAVEYNADTNELWISNMERLNELTADSKGEYGSLQEATNALRKDTEDLINTLTDLNEQNRDGSADWIDLKSSVKDARKEILSLLDEIVEQASDAVDSIQDVYDTLHSAADEYAETGCITIDTLQAIIGMGEQYVAYLVDENDNLVINEERIRDVIAARTQQMAIESSLSYIEALRIAKMEEDIEALNNLLYATEKTADATWGFVYASLALAGLDDQQYQAALSNINAIRSLADSAVQSIGQTASSVTDELNEMRTGLDDILKYVMDMLKQRINDQIDALGDMKDAYSEIIDEKKKSLEATKDEADYEKSRAKRLKEIAKLQARIDVLGLDDSREAQAERAKLLEELAELQEDLADEQADKSLEATKDALDDMEDVYHKEKDEEIAILEDSISSYQKLYDMAIDYIQSHWDTLYNELISWNSQYGSVLNSEITSAWDNALAAAQRYGDYVSALNNINSDIDASSSQNKGQNLIVGKPNYDNQFTTEEGIKAAVSRMKENSAMWPTASEDGKKRLADENVRIAKNELTKYGIDVDIGKDGVWYLKDGRKLYQVYHTGGFAGIDGTVKDNEVMAKLEKGEAILTKPMWTTLMESADRISQITEAFMGMPYRYGASAIPDFSHLNGGTINNVTTSNSSQPVVINQGDVIIQGNASNDTVARHIEVNREMVNEIARVLRIKR